MLLKALILVAFIGLKLPRLRNFLSLHFLLFRHYATSAYKKKQV